MTLQALEDRTVPSFLAPANYDVARQATAAVVGDLRNSGISDIVTADGLDNAVSVLLGNGDGTFRSPMNFPAGNAPASVVMGDFNHDGNLDLAVANDTPFGTVSILLGNGDGTFQAPIPYSVFTYPATLTVADVNGDGNCDLIVTTNGGGGASGRVEVLLNNGDGLFRQGQILNVGSSMLRVAAGDFNGDGITDLAVADSAGTVSILTGNGDGTFQDAHDYSTNLGPIGIVAGDFNNDGVTDLALADQGSPTPFGVSVLLGNGDGTFQAPRTVSLSAEPQTLAAADLNGDGALDLVVATTAGVTTLLGHGDGSLTVSSSLGVGAPAAVALPDLNGDHVPDLVTANGSGSVGVRLGNGDGSFQATPASAASVNPYRVASGDVNGDGFADLVTIGSGGISVLMSNGDGTFQPPTTVPDNGVLEDVALGDFNGDGHLDFVVANYSTNSVDVFLGNGDGTFHRGGSFAVGQRPIQIAIGDINGDGLPDLVVACQGPISHRPSISVLLDNGDGTFRTSADIALSTPGFNSSVAVGDVNGDGQADLVVQVFTARPPGEIQIFLGNGDGTFQAPTSMAELSWNEPVVAVADLTGDGIADIVTAAEVFLGNGDGTFQLSARPEFRFGLVALADFNGDGVLDGLIFTGSETFVVLGNGDGTFRNLPDSYGAGVSPRGPTVGDFNGDGLPDVAIPNMDSNDVSILINAGTWSAPSPSGGHRPRHLPAAPLGDALITPALVLVHAPVAPKTSSDAIARIVSAPIVAPNVADTAPSIGASTERIMPAGVLNDRQVPAVLLDMFYTQESAWDHS